MREIGTFVNTFHGVSGTLHARGERTLVIRGFQYDGLGPDAFLMAGTQVRLLSGLGF